MPLVAGVDSSTQSCKVEIRDCDTGRLIGRGSAPHPRTSPPVSEQNPQDWWNALSTALTMAVENAEISRYEIRGISVAAQCHGLVLLGADGSVLRPVKLWNDLTSAPQSEAMIAEMGAEFWADAVGSVPTAAFTVSKLAWVAENEPQLMDIAWGACLPHDWLTWKLSGRLVTDRSGASGTGYYSARQATYRWDILERFAGVDQSFHLPEVLGPDTASGRITVQAAQELGLDPEVVVGPGVGDQHAAALGMGIGQGDVVFSLGTSGVVMALSENSIHDPTGMVTGVCDATGRYLPLTCSLNSTKVVDWFRDLLGVDFDEFDRLALSVPSQDRTVTLAAFFDGERSPSLPYAMGILAGLTPETSRAQVARAGVDGVVMGLLEGLDAIEGCGVDTTARVIAAGGGAASQAWRQSIADLLGRPVHLLEAPGATVRGACLQAATLVAGVKIDEMVEAWRPPIVSTTHPKDQTSPWVRESYKELASYRGMDRRW